MSDSRSIATLYVYRGTLGLPSVDPKCLQLLLFLRLNPDHNIRIRTSPFGTSPVLPALEHGGKIYTVQESIYKKLEELTGSPCDSSLTAKQKSRVMAYKRLTSDLFENGFILNFWGIEDNSAYLTKVYGSEKYFPFGMVFARRLNKYTQGHLERICGDRTFEVSQRDANASLENYMHYLSVVLNSSEYVMGAKATSFDAHVIGYLAPLLVLKLPNPWITGQLTRYDRLCRYVRNFLALHGDRVQVETPPTDVARETDNDRAPVALIFCAGVCALVAMVGYGVMNDIIRIK